MKNETARQEIKSLDYYLQNHTNDYSEESHMAMMMAIEALEQEFCDDCISRSEVHDLLATWLFDNLSDATREALETIDGKIEDLLPVTPKAGWIPTSERLPEPSTAVLLTVRYKSTGQWTYQIGYWEKDLEKWEKWLEIGTLDDEFEILAWMELPEGYKEDSHE